MSRSTAIGAYCETPDASWLKGDLEGYLGIRVTLQIHTDLRPSLRPLIVIDSASRFAGERFKFTLMRNHLGFGPARCTL